MLYKYQIDKNSEYTVQLKNNNFYKDEKLPSGKYYLSDLIDVFEIEFEYEFKSSQKMSLQYTHNITADLVATIDDKEIWTRNFTLKKETINKINDNHFKLNDRITIDFEYIKDLATSYKMTYGIDADMILKVKFNIDYDFDDMISKDKLNDDIELDIIIDDKLTDVNENYNDKITNNFKINNGSLHVKECIYYLIGITLIIITIPKSYTIIKQFLSHFVEKEHCEIEPILKRYKDLIIKVQNRPDFSSFRELYLLKFSDLVNVAEQNNSYIIYYELEKKFYVIVDESTYIYELRTKK